MALRFVGYRRVSSSPGTNPGTRMPRPVESALVVYTDGSLFPEWYARSHRLEVREGATGNRMELTACIGVVHDSRGGGSSLMSPVSFHVFSMASTSASSSVSPHEPTAARSHRRLAGRRAARPTLLGLTRFRIVSKREHHSYREFEIRSSDCEHDDRFFAVSKLEARRAPPERALRIVIFGQFAESAIQELRAEYGYTARKGCRDNV